LEESYNQTGIIDLLKVALLKTHSGTHGFEFEEFIQELLVCQYGEDAIPSSPFLDGGVDAFFQRIDGDKVFPLLNKQTTIVQISTTEDTESKIKKTIEELKKQNRNFNSLLYFTSREVSGVDKKEELLEETYPGIRIKIKTATQLAINYAEMCPNACKRFNTKMLGFQSSDSKRYLKIDYTPLYLHIWQHHTNAQAMEDLKTNMADGLIIWALRDTNPEENKFLTDQEIYQTIEQEFPSAKQVIKSIIPQRIKFLSKRRTQVHRQQMIQLHKGNKYCLPYETREEYMFIEEKNNALFELIKLSFSKKFKEHGVSNELKIAQLNDLALYALKSLFEKYGMTFYHILEDSNGKSVTFNINDAVQLAIDDDFRAGTYSKYDARIVAMTIHDMINEPDENQKELLNNLKHLFILHILMKNDMKLATFFNTVSDELILYVNSDILIRAITERYVDKEGQRYRNILKFLNQTKAELRVTQFTINEVVYNMRAADWEFRNHLQNHEFLFDRYTASMLPKIMNRAYFYSKLDGKVTSWGKFINNFCTYSTLHSPEYKAFEEIRKYITDSFGLKYFSEEEMGKNIKYEIFEKLTKELTPYKKTVDIAKGVVATVLNIKYDREQNKEYLNNSLLGYRTWWLTEEVRSYNILKRSLEDRKFAMRPDFIIDTLMMTPSSRDIKKSYANTFTTTLGVQMAKHLSKETLSVIMKEMAELSEYEEPRVKAMFTDIFEQAAEISKPNKEDEMYECIDENEDNHDENIEWKEKLLEIIESSKKRHLNL
jgi:hypothetical protein